MQVYTHWVNLEHGKKGTQECQCTKRIMDRSNGPNGKLTSSKAYTIWNILWLTYTPEQRKRGMHES